MPKRQISMQNAQTEILSGRLRFDELRDNAAPYVSRHRLTVGGAPHLPCFTGQFGINDLGEGQTVHQSQIEPEVEFETSFTAKSGVLVSILTEGKLEFSLDGQNHCYEVTSTPIALAWANQEPVNVTRRTCKNDTLIKVQVHTPLSFFDQNWRQDSNCFVESHARVLHWTPGISASNSARALFKEKDESVLRKQMARARFAVEALDSLLQHLESASSSQPVQRLAMAHSFVEQTAETRPSLSEIASATGFSISALQRAYRLTYGMTVIEHQRQMLLDQAMDTLCTNDVSVAQVAARAGYSNPTNFSSAFQKYFGMSPSQASKTLVG